MKRRIYRPIQYFISSALLAVLLALATSCSSHQMTLSPSGRMIIPEHPNWHYGEKVFKNPICRPDPRSLYVFHYSRFQSSLDTTPLEGYHFFRFWPNGRLFYRNQLIEGRTPTPEDGDTFLKMGTLPGRYFIDGNQIYIELFDFYGEYKQRTGIITEKEIALKAERDYIYKYERVQFPAGAMTSMPDW